MRTALILCLLTILTLNTGFTNRDARSYYEEGLQSLAQKNYVKAIGDFTSAISMAPRFADAYFERANAKEMLAQQAGYISTEHCQDWIQSLRLGKREAAEKLMQYYGIECASGLTLQAPAEEVLCINWSSQNLHHLPASLTQTGNLLWLDISGNRLQNVGPELAKSSQLLSLDASHNSLLVADTTLLHLVHLQELNLSYNHLQVLPEGVGKMQLLKELYLRNNELKNLPTSIGDLQSLEYLDLSMNQLTELPASVAKLQHLKVLKLAGNPLSAASQQTIRNLIPNGCRVEFE